MGLKCPKYCLILVTHLVLIAQDASTLSLRDLKTQATRQINVVQPGIAGMTEATSTLGDGGSQPD